MSCLVIFAIAGRDMGSYRAFDAPVAQLDRALPSEGRGQRFESSRVHHLILNFILLSMAWCAYGYFYPPNYTPYVLKHLVDT